MRGDVILPPVGVTGKSVSVSRSVGVSFVHLEGVNVSESSGGRFETFDANERFVIVRDDEGYGVWRLDDLEDGEPIERFSDDERGYEAAASRWKELSAGAAPERMAAAVEVGRSWSRLSYGWFRQASPRSCTCRSVPACSKGPGCSNDLFGGLSWSAWWHSR